MVAITLRFTVCSCLYRETECHFGSADRDPREDRLWQGSVARQTSATRGKTHCASRTSAGLSQLSQRQVVKAASAPVPAAGRRRSHLRRPTDHPLAIERRAARSRPASSAAPPNKGSLLRADDDDPRQHVPSADRELLPPADRGRPPIGGRRLARAEARHRSTSTRDGHDKGHARAS